MALGLDEEVVDGLLDALHVFQLATHRKQLRRGGVITLRYKVSVDGGQVLGRLLVALIHVVELGEQRFELTDALLVDLDRTGPAETTHLRARQGVHRGRAG